ncbi:hypothetical protein F4679DRAFT_561796 [Xylaria curta]|nr:hypothetical protein F4679DRAFT_561796 [Xylaria curta]
MPNYHPVAGHLVVLRECSQVLPQDTIIHFVIQHMVKQFPKGVFTELLLLQRTLSEKIKRGRSRWQLAGRTATAVSDLPQKGPGFEPPPQ